MRNQRKFSQVNNIDGYDNYCIGIDSEDKISFLISFDNFSSEYYKSPYNGNNICINFNFNGKVKVGNALMEEKFILLQLKNKEIAKRFHSNLQKL